MKGFLNALGNMGAEFRGVMRGMMRKPGYAIAAWVMLGLAIAANAAVFAIVWGFLLKPLPYAQPGQLSEVRERLPKIGLNYALVTVRGYLALKQNVSGLANAGLAEGSTSEPITLGGQTRLLSFQRVTPSLLTTLGAQPVLGRLPAADAGRPGGPAEAVVSYHFWQSFWGGRRDVLNKSLKVGGKTYRIVGVMPRDFFVKTGDTEAWLPYVITPTLAKSGNLSYRMYARRKPGVSLAQLNLELKQARERLLAKASPSVRARLESRGFTIDARPIRAVELHRLGVGKLPWLLQAAAGLLLLLALANTINLGLVRQRARQHEFALRRALGASRAQLVRLIMIEHLPILLAVGGVAMLLAWIAIGALHAFGLPPTFSPFHVTFGSVAIVFVWVLTALSLLIVAVGPALLASGRKLFSTLGHGPTAVAGHGSRRLQRALGIIQVSLACALIVASGLLGVSLWRVLTKPLGFETQHRIEATVILPHDMKSSPAWATLHPELERLPGVTGAAVANMIPFSQIGADRAVVRPVNSDASVQPSRVNMPSVSSGFFQVLGMKVLAGRTFSRTEVAHQAPVAVISAALARHFFGSAGNAIGKTLSIRKSRIVGVTQDIAWQPEGNNVAGTVFLPYGDRSPGPLIAIIQTRAPTVPLMNAFKRRIQSALPGSAVVKVATLPHLVKGASAFRSAGAGVVGAFAALALLLAALGVFAITSFIARARLGEYGIRAALGASPLALLRLGFREAAWLLVIGLPIGLAGAYLLGRVIASALYRTPVLDPWLYIVGAALIALVVFAAAWGPARKAARVPIRNLLGGGGSP